MRAINQPENAILVQPGLYKILRVIRFSDTRLYPVALVSYKPDVSYFASNEVAFYIALENLLRDDAIVLKNMLPEDLQGKTIYVKEVADMPRIRNGKLILTKVAEWEVLDMFKLYDLYKQQGNILTIPQADWDEYAELERIELAMNENIEGENALFDEINEDNED